MEITITSGAGGIDSQDFVQMLKNMYIEWAKLWELNWGVLVEKENRVVLTLEKTDRLDQEHGIHRLVRLSPHDPKKRRHTSFVGVSVEGQVDINSKDDWGSQVRSYVFHPYKMAKNHITDEEWDDPEKYMRGKINGL